MDVYCPYLTGKEVFYVAIAGDDAEAVCDKLGAFTEFSEEIKGIPLISGDEILIGYDSGGVYRVKAGDGAEDIERNLGGKIRDILKENGCEYFYPGQKLRYKSE
ncbi:MAG: LysM peptidoglycan-binding domain-containing protein [Clostridia bacterium]|nr:LysM peptidoglycan-binding domain-containing protein [Clostridia bacterium]